MFDAVSVSLLNNGTKRCCFERASARRVVSASRARAVGGGGGSGRAGEARRRRKATRLLQQRAMTAITGRAPFQAWQRKAWMIIKAGERGGRMISNQKRKRAPVRTSKISGGALARSLVAVVVVFVFALLGVKERARAAEGRRLWGGGRWSGVWRWERVI